MLRYVYAEDLTQFPLLQETMFKDRARQFRDRLGWDVCVNSKGHERDQYDDGNPLYVIWENPDGSHGGSLRFLPTTEPTMVNDHFSHLMDGSKICHPLIWECTRFCLSEKALPQVSAALMLGGMEMGLQFQLTDVVGVFDRRMKRIYSRLGWIPTILGEETGNVDPIAVGIWEFDAAIRPKLLKRSGISAPQSEMWFDRSFGVEKALMQMVV